MKLKRRILISSGLFSLGLHYFIFMFFVESSVKKKPVTHNKHYRAAFHFHIRKKQKTDAPHRSGEGRHKRVLAPVHQKAEAKDRKKTILQAKEVKKGKRRWEGHRKREVFQEKRQLMSKKDPQRVRKRREKQKSKQDKKIADRKGALKLKKLKMREKKLGLDVSRDAQEGVLPEGHPQKEKEVNLQLKGALSPQSQGEKGTEVVSDMPPVHSLTLPLVSVPLPEDYRFQGFFPRSYILQVQYQKKQSHLNFSSLRKKEGGLDMVDKAIIKNIKYQLRHVPKSYIKGLNHYLDQSQKKSLILSVPLSFYESSDGIIQRNLQ